MEVKILLVPFPARNGQEVGKYVRGTFGPNYKSFVVDHCETRLADEGRVTGWVGDKGPMTNIIFYS